MLRGPVSHGDYVAGGGPGDPGSVDSEALCDLLHGYPGYVGFDEFQTLWVAQTILRLEPVHCHWTTLFASGRSFEPSGGVVRPALATSDERSEWSGGV